MRRPTLSEICARLVPSGGGVGGLGGWRVGGGVGRSDIIALVQCIKSVSIYCELSILFRFTSSIDISARKHKCGVI